MSIQEQEDNARSPLDSWLGNPLKAFYNARIITVEPVVFLYLLFSVQYTYTIEQYYYHYYGEKILRNTSFVFPNGSYCMNSSLINEYSGSNNTYKIDETSSNNLVIYTELAAKVPSIVTAIVMGPISDRYGRKIAIILPSFGFLVQALASVLLYYFQLNPYFFIPVRFFAGATGDFTTLIAGTFAYVADISSIKWRTVRIAAVSGGLGFGKMAAVLCAGVWLGAVNCNFLPLLIFCTAIMAVLLLYIVICLPESRPKPEERTFSEWRKQNVLNKYVEGAKLYCGRCSFNSWSLIVLTISLAVLVLTLEGSQVIVVYFLKAPPFDFNSAQMGYYQAVRAGTQGLCNVLFFLLVLLKLRDSWIVLGGMVISCTCNMLTGFSNTVWELYTVSSLQGLEALLFSAGRGMASKLVQPEQQGSLFSIIASAESIASLAANTVWPYVFPITLTHNLRPGTTFMFMAAVELVTIPLLVSIVYMDTRNMKTKPKKKTRYEVLTYDDKKSDYSKSENTSAVSSSSEDDEYQPLLTSKDKYDLGININR